MWKATHGPLEVLGQLDEARDGGLVGLLAEEIQQASDVGDGGFTIRVVAGGGKGHG